MYDYQMVDNAVDKNKAGKEDRWRKLLFSHKWAGRVSLIRCFLSTVLKK